MTTVIVLAFFLLLLAPCVFALFAQRSHDPHAEPSAPFAGDLGASEAKTVVASFAAPPSLKADLPRVPVVDSLTKVTGSPLRSDPPPAKPRAKVAAKYQSVPREGSSLDRMAKRAEAEALIAHAAAARATAAAMAAAARAARARADAATEKADAAGIAASAASQVAAAARAIYADAIERYEETAAESADNGSDPSRPTGPGSRVSRRAA